jgi:hypothetical protein
LTTDIWSSKNRLAFMAITAHFIEKDRLETVLLSFNEMTDSHTGIEIAEVINKVLNKMEIPISKVLFN